MRTLPILASLCALGLAVPAMAQTNSSTNNSGSTNNSSSTTNAGSNNNAAANPMPPGAMQKDVKSDLEKAGFTDVQVMPSSFLVRAKDKQGRPVMMVINPDSVTELTNVGKPASTSHK